MARCQPPSAVALRTVDLRCRATPEVVGPGSRGAIPTTRLVIVLGGTGVDYVRKETDRRPIRDFDPGSCGTTRDKRDARLLYPNTLWGSADEIFDHDS